MKVGKKGIPLVEEVSKEKNKKDLIIGLNKNKSEEDENSTHSADFSGNDLKENQNPNIPNKVSYPLVMNQKQLERYNEKLKEKTMRMEIDKKYTETERLKNKYEAKYSNLHTFDNNPQFQKMLKKVGNQLFLFFLCGIIYFLFNSFIYFYASNKKEGFCLVGMCLSIIAITFFIILFISLNMGLLNDPNLSKTFRIFILIEVFLIIFSFSFNIILALISTKYLKKMKDNKYIAYIIFILMILITLIILKFCWNLFVESVLILFGKKTEYSILILKEQSLKKNEMNFNTNLSYDNNMTTESLTNSVALFNNEPNKEKDKEEEQYKAFNYFNRFHYSITSVRQGEFSSYKKNKN